MGRGYTGELLSPRSLRRKEVDTLSEVIEACSSDENDAEWKEERGLGGDGDSSGDEMKDDGLRIRPVVGGADSGHPEGVGTGTLHRSASEGGTSLIILLSYSAGEAENRSREMLEHAEEVKGEAEVESRRLMKDANAMVKDAEEEVKEVAEGGREGGG